MIIPESERSESKVPTVRSGESETSWQEPPSPPPYSATIASNDDQYQRDRPVGISTNNSPSSPTPALPPRCNYLIERKANTSVSGTWHVDTGLAIPEGLLPPITEYDGAWNQDTQKARKAREKEMKRRGERRSPLPIVPETRPNLMLASTNGSIKGDVHIVSSDGLTRQAVIVAQGTNGAINLTMNASSEQPLRVYANSTNGSVNVRIPMAFEGAVTMATTWGKVKLSDAIKARLTTFSSTSNTSRCFIGDWQSSGFGSTPQTPDPNGDPPLPIIDSDPFTSWTGPLIRLGSTNGSLTLSFIEESVSSPPSGLAGAMRSWMGGWFGGGGNNENSGPSQSPPSPPSHPSRPPHSPLPWSDRSSNGHQSRDIRSLDQKTPTPVTDLD